jgi:hypothetical protein
MGSRRRRRRRRRKMRGKAALPCRWRRRGPGRLVLQLLQLAAQQQGSRRPARADGAGTRECAAVLPPACAAQC